MFQELTDPYGNIDYRLQDLQQVLSTSGKLTEDGQMSLLAITGWQKNHYQTSSLAIHHWQLNCPSALCSYPLKLGGQKFGKVKAQFSLNFVPKFKISVLTGKELCKI